MDTLIRFAIFLVPMILAFLWLWWKYGVTQATLDLLAFNLWFDFDFAALLPGNIKLSVIYVLVLLLVFLQLLHALRRGVISVNQTTFLAVVLSFVIAVWIAIAFLVNFSNTWGIGRIAVYIVRVYWLHILLIIVGLQLAKGRQLRRFAKIFLVTGLLVSAVSVVQTASNGALLTNDRSPYYLGFLQPLGEKSIDRRDYTEQSVGFINAVQMIQFSNITFYRSSGTSFGSGEQLSASIIIALYFALTTRRLQILWFSIFIGYTVGLLTTFGRTQIAVVFVVCFFLALSRWRRLLSPSRLIPLIAILILTIGVVAAYFEPISTLVMANIDGFTGQRGSKEVGSLNGRTSLWLYVGTQIIRNPVFGSAEPITFRRAGWADADDIEIGAHNSFLDLAYRAGILPAFLLILLYLMYLWRSFVLSFKRTIPLEDRSIFGAFCLTGVMLIVTQSMTTDLIFAPQAAALFWIPCGYVMAFSRRIDAFVSNPSLSKSLQLSSANL